MSLLGGIRNRLRGEATRLRRLKAATQFLMRHVGMTGHCECLSLRDADGRRGYLLLIHTNQLIPIAYRESFQSYFRRKLGELQEIIGRPSLMLVVRDGNDLMRARHQPELVNAARVASIIAAANEDAGQAQAAERLAELRRHFTTSRLRHGDSGYMPPHSAPMTNLGALEPR